MPLGAIKMEPIIQVKDLQFNYPGGVKAVNGVCFEVGRGEKVALLGPNGSGKSTLILLISGLLTPKKGEITVLGQKTSSKEFAKIRQKIGIVFQDPDDQLFTQSVIEDIEYGPKNLRLPENQVKAQSSEVLSKIGIEHLQNRPPHRLSFGEKKKVSLATALVLKPELLILDEPTANLDLASRRALIDTLNELNRSGTTIVISTHDVEALPGLVDRVVLITHGSMLGQGAIGDVLQDSKLLKEAGFEPPVIVELFTKLQSMGVVDRVPLTVEDSLKLLEKLKSET
jgi:cobalt/nickel transport system ATP-binding protein